MQNTSIKDTTVRNTNASDASTPEEPPSSQKSASKDNHHDILGWVKSFMRKKSDSNEESLREALVEYIDVLSTEEETPTVATHERQLISNILKLRDTTASDVMIPRADIIAIEQGTTAEELLQVFVEQQFSRMPVYRGTLDDILGVIHVKDLFSVIANGGDITLRSLIRDVPIVSPSLPVLDLLLLMRQTKKHMVLVVDEYGGIDGLATIGDVLESILGEVDDEHDEQDAATMQDYPDGTVIASARLPIEEFEERYGKVLTDDDRENIDTLGGYIFSLAGRIPARGEIIIGSDQGLNFEILEADPRSVHRIRIRRQNKKNIDQEKSTA